MTTSRVLSFSSVSTMQLTPLTGTMTWVQWASQSGNDDATHSPHGDDDRRRGRGRLPGQLDATHSPHGDDDRSEPRRRRRSRDATHSPHGDDDPETGFDCSGYVCDATHSPHGDDDTYQPNTEAWEAWMQLTPLTGTMTVAGSISFSANAMQLTPLTGTMTSGPGGQVLPSAPMQLTPLTGTMT